MEVQGIARPWARGIFEHAKQTSSVDLWSTILAVLDMALAEPGFRRVCLAPGLGSSQALVFLEGLRDASGNNLFPSEGSTLFALLMESKRLSMVHHIRMDYEALRRDAEGIVALELETARILGEADLAVLRPMLEKRYGPRLLLTTKVNPDLLGGFIVRRGDEVLDASLRHDLQRLSQTLSVHY